LEDDDEPYDRYQQDEEQYGNDGGEWAEKGVHES